MRPLAILLPFLLAACNAHDAGGNGAPGVDGSKQRSYSGIGADETLRFTGTEPFWGGHVTGAALTYETPENPKGTAIAVHRFAGNNGLSFSGELAGAPFDMAVTEAPCGDGMSDRVYPFTVTLKLAGETRKGCGWTDRRGFTGPAAP